MGLVVLSVALIPLGVLISAALDSSLRRRPGFWGRLVGFALCATLPELVLAIGSAVGALHGEPVVPLLLGLFWGLVLVSHGSRLLFLEPGADPGQSDEGGQGPDTGDDNPTPPPIGGLPLPEAEQSSIRLRGPRPGGAAIARRRNPAEPVRRPARIVR